MKATGIVRRIDNLGRIVIPKEIRKTMRIKEGDALEIYTDREGEVILKKYSPIEELEEYASKYAEALYQTLGHSIFVTDMDQIIAASGIGKKEAMNKKISSTFEDVINNREQVIFSVTDKNYFPLYPEMSLESDSILITPIINEGTVIGSVVILQKVGKNKLDLVEKKLAETGAYYLGNQME